MKSKKLLLMCLSILMILGLIGGFSLTANAEVDEEEGTYEGFEYYNRNGIIISGYNGEESNITIPKELNGMKVCGITIYAFEDCNILENVVIEAGIKSISSNAFDGCYNLRSITLPNSIKSIESRAFRGCNKLEKVVMGNQVESIEDYAFMYCRSLKSITIPNSVQRIDDSSFRGCESLKSITIPDNVEEIGNGLFYDCSNLESAVLSKGLKIINREMFYNCENLKSITIPSSIKKIKGDAFAQDNNLKRINYDGTVEQWNEIKIDFTGNECLKTATIYCTDGTIEYVKPTEFYENNYGKQFAELRWEKALNATGYEIQLATDKEFTKDKKTVVINKQSQTRTIVKNLKANQKYYMRGRVYKSQVVNQKTTNSYSKWSEVTEIKLLATKSNDRVSGDYEYSINKDNTATITAYAGNETKLTIPSSLGGKKVTKIGENAFEGLDLKSVKIPNTVTEIGKKAFYACQELESVSMPTGLKKIGDTAFAACERLKKVAIPSTVTEIGSYVFAYCHKLESVDLSKGLKKIDNGAFDECMKLKKIVIPDGVTEIGGFAFLHCPKLTSVKLSKNLKKLGIDAFYGCGFKSITIPNGVKEIPSGLFGDCKSLTKVVLPNNITKIGENAFYFTKLKTITIPKSVKKIDEYAFSDSFYLCHIKYTGTKKQWKTIKIVKNNEELTNAMISCKDATINNKSVKIKTVTKANKAVKVSWSKVSKASGYKIQVATNSKFTKVAKTVLVSTPKTTSVTVKGLKANKKYYVRMCTYSTKKIADNASVNLYYPWSNVKSVTTK